MAYMRGSHPSSVLMSSPAWSVTGRNMKNHSREMPCPPVYDSTPYTYAPVGDLSNEEQDL